MYMCPRRDMIAVECLNGLYEIRTYVNVSVQYGCEKCIIFWTVLLTALSATNITQSPRKVNELGVEHLVEWYGKSRNEALGRNICSTATL